MSTRNTRDIAPSPYRDHEGDLQQPDPGEVEVHEAAPVQVEQPRRGWWARRTGLEKVGVVALSVASALVGVALAAPRFMKATVGGGLTAAGAWLLREGFDKQHGDGDRR